LIVKVLARLLEMSLAKPLFFQFFYMSKEAIGFIPVRKRVVGWLRVLSWLLLVVYTVELASTILRMKAVMVVVVTVRNATL